MLSPWINAKLFNILTQKHKQPHDRPPFMAVSIFFKLQTSFKELLFSRGCCCDVIPVARSDSCCCCCCGAGFNGNNSESEIWNLPSDKTAPLSTEASWDLLTESLKSGVLLKTAECSVPAVRGKPLFFCPSLYTLHLFSCFSLQRS